jgi:hypothetical protein
VGAIELVIIGTFAIAALLPPADDVDILGYVTDQRRRERGA